MRMHLALAVAIVVAAATTSVAAAAGSSGPPRDGDGAAAREFLKSEFEALKARMHLLSPADATVRQPLPPLRAQLASYRDGVRG